MFNIYGIWDLQDLLTPKCVLERPAYAKVVKLSLYFDSDFMPI